MDWYYRRAGKVIGPVSARIIVELARVGKLDADDEVRAGPQGRWQRAAAMPGLGMQSRGRAAVVQAAPLSLQSPASHWRGSLPLQNSLLFYFLVPLLISQLLIWMVANTQPPSIPLLYALIAAALVALPWQFIGAWRAISHNRLDGRGWRSPPLLRGLLIAGAALVFINLAFLPSMQQKPGATGQAAGVTPQSTISRQPVETYPGESLIDQLWAEPAMARLRSNLPDEAMQLSALVESLAPGSSSAEMWHSVDYELAKLAISTAGFAPDTELIAYINVELQKLRALADDSDKLCAQSAFGTAPAGMQDHLPAALLQRERRAYVDLIVAAHINPQSPPDRSLVQEGLKQAYAKVASQFGDGVYKLAEPENSGFDDEKLCEVVQSIYLAFLHLPPASRGAVLRYTVGTTG